eukprot:scaffold40490_cov63-Phaeocystis_antarctica.AAC.1
MRSARLRSASGGSSARSSSSSFFPLSSVSNKPSWSAPSSSASCVSAACSKSVRRLGGTSSSACRLCCTRVRTRPTLELDSERHSCSSSACTASSEVRFGPSYSNRVSISSPPSPPSSPSPPPPPPPPPSPPSPSSPGSCSRGARRMRSRSLPETRILSSFLRPLHCERRLAEGALRKGHRVAAEVELLQCALLSQQGHARVELCLAPVELVVCEEQVAQLEQRRVRQPLPAVWALARNDRGPCCGLVGGAATRADLIVGEVDVLQHGEAEQLGQRRQPVEGEVEPGEARHVGQLDLPQLVAAEP